MATLNQGTLEGFAPPPPTRNTVAPVVFKMGPVICATCFFTFVAPRPANHAADVPFVMTGCPVCPGEAQP